MKFRTKITINQEIFTFIGFPNLSLPQYAQKCPNSRPNECLFHFGVSPCLIRNGRWRGRILLKMVTITQGQECCRKRNHDLPAHQRISLPTTTTTTPSSPSPSPSIHPHGPTHERRRQQHVNEEETGGRTTKKASVRSGSGHIPGSGRAASHQPGTHPAHPANNDGL